MAGSTQARRVVPHRWLVVDSSISLSCDTIPCSSERELAGLPEPNLSCNVLRATGPSTAFHRGLPSSKRLLRDLADLLSLVRRESHQVIRPQATTPRQPHAFDSPHVLTRLDQSGSDQQVAGGASAPTAPAASRQAGPTDPSCLAAPPRNQHGRLAGVSRS
jgi:hypothetical protein